MKRSGIHHPKLWLFGSWGVAAALLIATLTISDQTRATDERQLVVYCSAVLRPAIRVLAERYQNVHGVAIETRYGGSGALLAGLELAGDGDLFIAADQGYLNAAASRGLIQHSQQIGSMSLVIAVKRDNPKQINSLEELLRDDVRLGLANPKTAAAGEAARSLLKGKSLWELVSKHARVLKPSVTEVANDVVLGTLDAAIVWDATVAQLDRLTAIKLRGSESPSVQGRVAIGLLTTASNAEDAKQFAHYLASPSLGLPVFARFGISVNANTTPPLIDAQR